MRITYLAAAHSIHTVRWVNALAERGHSIQLVTVHAPVPAFPVDERVELVVLRRPAPLGYYLNTNQATRALRRFEPQVLHAHYVTGYGTLSRLTDFHPAVLSAWGSDIPGVGESGWWKRRLVRKNLAAADRICATSQFLRSAVRSFLAPGREVDETPFGVDVVAFRPEREGQTPANFVVGTVKALEPGYRIDRLLEAFALFRKRFVRDNEAKLVVGGEGPLREQLAALASRLGIADVTEFRGRIPHEQVPGVLREFSVFVALSAVESFGVAVLEASACGIPVVVSNVGGLTEVTVPSETGYVIRGGQVVEAAEAIGSLYLDRENARRMGTAGRDFVVRKYEWRASVSRMERVYQELLAGID